MYFKKIKKGNTFSIKIKVRFKKKRKKKHAVDQEKKKIQEKRKKKTQRKKKRLGNKISTTLSTKKKSFKILLFFFYKFPPLADQASKKGHPAEANLKSLDNVGNLIENELVVAAGGAAVVVRIAVVAGDAVIDVVVEV